MKIGFTGTRKGMTSKQLWHLEELLYNGYRHEFHHGDCVGADAQAHEVARGAGHVIVAHPCTLSDQRAFCKADTILQPKTPLQRNRDIVDAVEHLVAAPATLYEVIRSGTWATIRYARKTGRVSIRILEP